MQLLLLSRTEGVSLETTVYNTQMHHFFRRFKGNKGLEVPRLKGGLWRLKREHRDLMLATCVIARLQRKMSIRYHRRLTMVLLYEPLQDA